MAVPYVLLITEDEVKNLTEITGNVDVSKFCAWIPIAQDKHIKNAIGEECYNNLLDGTENSNLTALETTLLNGNNRQYLGIKQALAWWVLWYAYPNLHSNISATGIHTKNGEEFSSIDDSLLRTRMNRAKDQAEYYLDQVICYLKDNSADYPCYLNSDSCCEEPLRHGYGSSGIVIDTDRVRSNNAAQRDRYLKGNGYCPNCGMYYKNCCCVC